MDTVRIPMSLVPYEDPSANHQRLLKKQMREQADISEGVTLADEEAAVEAVSVSEAAGEADASKEAVSAANEASEADPQTTQHTTSDTQKKD